MTQEEFNTLDWRHNDVVRLSNGKEYLVKIKQTKRLILWTDEYEKYFMATPHIIECRTYVNPNDEEILINNKRRKNTVASEEAAEAEEKKKEEMAQAKAESAKKAEPAKKAQPAEKPQPEKEVKPAEPVAAQAEAEAPVKKKRARIRISKPVAAEKITY